MVSTIRLIRGLFIVSFICYIASWFLPCLDFSYGKKIEAAPGWSLAFMGILAGWANLQFAAYANLFYLFIIPLIWRGDYGKARGYGIIGLALASQTFFLRKIQADDPQPSYLTGYEIGFYLWFSAFVLVVACTLIEPALKLIDKSKQLKDIH